MNQLDFFDDFQLLKNGETCTEKSIFSSTHHVVGVEVFHGADVFTREGTRSGHFLIIPGFGTSFGGNVGHGEGDNARLEHEGNHFEIVCRGCFAFGEERLKPMRNVSELNDN